MRKALAIAGVNLRRMANDRTSLFFTVALPVVIILLIGQATQRFEPGETPAGLHVAGDGPLAVALATELRQTTDLIDWQPYEDADQLRRDVRRGVVAAGVAIPAGYDETLTAGGEADVSFVVDTTQGFPAGIRAAVADAVASQGAVLQAAAFASEAAAGSFEENLERARSIAASADAVGTETETIGDAEPVSFGTGFGYQAPANLVLFVFITSIAAAAQLIETRRLGVTRRVLGTPTSAGTVLGGEMLGRFAIALFQAVFIFVVGRLVFGVDWGDPLGAAALILVFVAIGTGVGMLFGTVFRTPEQAGAIGPPLGIALGMLGGCMWPLEIVPEPMQALGHLFPHAWAMDAWIDLTAFGRGIGGIAPELGVLAAYAAVLLGLSTWRLRRSIAVG